jgi:hypothetical protein
MFNPWLTLSIQMARFGWEAQAAVVAQMMQFAGAGVSRGGSAAPNNIAAPVDTAARVEVEDAAPMKVEDWVAPAAGLPPSIERPTRRGKHREVAQNAKAYKKRTRGSKRRHSQ